MIEAAAPAGTITQAFSWLPPASEVGAALRSRRRPTPRHNPPVVATAIENDHGRRLRVQTIQSYWLRQLPLSNTPSSAESHTCGGRATLLSWKHTPPDPGVTD